MGEIHITIESIALIVGLLAVVIPGAYMVGRFNQRLTTVEKQIETLLQEGIAMAVRIANALEALVATLKETDRHLQKRKD